MQIGCTKKLQEYLKKEISAVDTEIDPFFSWSASLATLNRRKTIIVVNDYSRCGFALYGMNAKTMKELENLICIGIQGLLESAAIAPDLTRSYLADCRNAVIYTKTKDRTAVARLNKFCERVEFYAEEFIPDIIMQRHLLRRFNCDLFSISGKYVEATDMLRQGFCDHYHVENPYMCRAAILNIRLMLDTPCFRRVEIPFNFTLWDLHNVIQKLFCWHDYHLHEFQSADDMPLDIMFPEYSSLLIDDDNPDTSQIEMKVFLSDVFSEGKMLRYLYDMGDDWEHEIEFVGINEAYTSATPCCIMGVGDAPPEDVGGIDGYAEFRKILSDPGHDEYNNIKMWADEIHWAPFDMEEINRKLQFA